MINQAIIKNAMDAGLPALKDLFKDLPKEDALKGIGILVIMAVGKTIIEAIRDIVLSKQS